MKGEARRGFKLPKAEAHAAFRDSLAGREKGCVGRPPAFSRRWKIEGEAISLKPEKRESQFDPKHQLYARRRDQVSLEKIERIKI